MNSLNKLKFIIKEEVNSCLLKEGGWQTVKTQKTQLTPQVTKEAIVYLEKFAKEFNTWLFKQDKNLKPIRLVRPVGSSTYYEKDIEDGEPIIYGDIDYLIEYPLLSTESPAKTMEEKRKLENKSINFYTKKIIEFVNTKRPKYLDVEKPITQANALIFKLSDEVYIQIDLVATTPEHAEWSAARFTPEHKIKGFATGGYFTVLADALKFSAGEKGVYVKTSTQDGSIVPFSLRKNTKLERISINPKTFFIDMASYLIKKFTGKKLNNIDPVLQKNPGLSNPASPTIKELARGIVGLAKTLEMHDGVLENLGFKSTKQLVQKIKADYISWVKEKLTSSKFEKAQTPEALKAIEKYKKHVKIAIELANEYLKV